MHPTANTESSSNANESECHVGVQKSIIKENPCKDAFLETVGDSEEVNIYSTNKAEETEVALYP